MQQHPQAAAAAAALQQQQISLQHDEEAACMAAFHAADDVDMPDSTPPGSPKPKLPPQQQQEQPQPTATQQQQQQPPKPPKLLSAAAALTPPAQHASASNIADINTTTTTSKKPPVPLHVPQVFTVGSGDMSQLGLGLQKRERRKPGYVAGLLKGKHIKHVAAGALHNIVITDTGALFSWGCNDDAALGRQGDEFTPQPIHIIDNAPSTTNTGGGGGGGGHAKNKPKRRATQKNNETTNDQKEDITATITTAPPPSPPLMQHALAGDCHSVALTNDGRVFTWGLYKDAKGIMGYNKTVTRQFKPTPVKGFGPKAKLGQVIDIAVGDNHDMALTHKGRVYEWGDVRIAQRGSERLKRATHLEPRLVQFPRTKIHTTNADGMQSSSSSSSNINKNAAGTHPRPRKTRSVPTVIDYISVCGYSNFARSKWNHWYVWGLNNYAQLALRHTDNVSMPTRNPAIEAIQEGSTVVAKITGGMHHVLALLQNKRKVYSWGRGDYGRLGHGPPQQLGNSDTADANANAAMATATASAAVLVGEKKKVLEENGMVLEPREVMALSELVEGTGDLIADIGAGEAHSLAVMSSGDMYGWGYGDLLQLGNGEEQDEFVPARMESKGMQRDGWRVVQAVGGSQHTIIRAVRK